MVVGAGGKKGGGQKMLGKPSDLELLMYAFSLSFVSFERLPHHFTVHSYALEMVEHEKSIVP